MFTQKYHRLAEIRVTQAGRGDQKVIVNVDIPTKLSSEQRELFEKLAETLGTAPKPQEKGFFDKLNEIFGG